MARFKASARAVEMLGRQQIAGIPNAISELFKNSYDAYADRVFVDYYVPQRLLVVRDNGLGMTKRDLEDKWLVIGTANKVSGRDGELSEIARTLGLEQRKNVGEKGIGRLAIGVIGPQVLVVSRARRLEKSHGAVAAFVNWSLFDIPDVSLDQIEVPVREFDSWRLPDKALVGEMTAEVQENLRRLKEYVRDDEAAEIQGNLLGFDFDPAVMQGWFGDLALSHDSYGTQFYIYPVDPMLDEVLDDQAKTGPRRASRAKLRNMLVGFTNTMSEDDAKPPIETGFVVHPTMDRAESIIGREEFFTQKEFSSADHHISGSFNEFGQFTGMVSIYGGKSIHHVIPWSEGRHQATDCGPFNLNLAYLQGQEQDSRMFLEDWNRLNRKLEVMGGLYIYRNGIRILPYGDPEFDFLRFEERRSRSAGRYFFSYRRMFGTIELSDDHKYKLREKAGREGFMENRAYRQFRSVLENFFVQLAVDFFRDDSPSNEFKETRQALGNRAATRGRRDAESRERRNEFERGLTEQEKLLSSGALDDRVNSIVAQFSAELGAAQELRGSGDPAAAALAAYLEAGRTLEQLRVHIRCPEPRGFGPDRSLRRRLDDYQSLVSGKEDTVIKPAGVQIEGEFFRVSADLDSVSGSEHLLESRIRAVAASEVSSLVAIGKKAVDTANEAAKKADESISSFLKESEGVINGILDGMDSAGVASFDGAMPESTLALKSEIMASSWGKRRAISDIARQFDSIKFEPDENGFIITGDDVASSFEEDVNDLREDAKLDLELIQLGMAVDIIDHEFQAVIRSLRNYTQSLRTWAVRNEGLAEIYQGIRVNFEHLDGYLRLFTPLRRRSGRTAIRILGSRIGDYVKQLFGTRLKDAEVELVQTEAFRNYGFTGYPSTFLPVFMNLVDNALYWLQHRQSDRLIRFDVDQDALLVYDNGPGIPHRDREAVFQPGFTRKPGGRGLGLYISWHELHDVGYNLSIMEPPEDEGTLFRIEPRESGDA